MKVAIEITDPALLAGLDSACKGWNDALVLKKGQSQALHPDFRTPETYLQDRVKDLLTKYAKQHGHLPPS